MIRRTGLAPWEFEFPFPGSLTSTFPGVRDLAVRGAVPRDAADARGRPPQGGTRSMLPRHTHMLPRHTHMLPRHTHMLPSHISLLPRHTHILLDTYPCFLDTLTCFLDTLPCLRDTDARGRPPQGGASEREFFIDNLLVRIH